MAIWGVQYRVLPQIFVTVYVLSSKEVLSAKLAKYTSVM